VFHSRMVVTGTVGQGCEFKVPSRRCKPKTVDCCALLCSATMETSKIITAFRGVRIR
jgi:hypothetical protein